MAERRREAHPLADGTERTELSWVEAGTGRAGAGRIALVPGALAPLIALDLPEGLRGAAREQVARRQLRDLTGLGDDRLQMRPFHGPRDPAAVRQRATSSTAATSARRHSAASRGP